jgi:hypothetical protein
MSESPDSSKKQKTKLYWIAGVGLVVIGFGVFGFYLSWLGTDTVVDLTGVQREHVLGVLDFANQKS